MKATTLGKRLAKARKAYEFTQAMLAYRLKVDVGTVSRWERGLSLPDDRSMRVLRAVLGVVADGEPTP